MSKEQMSRRPVRDLLARLDAADALPGVAELRARSYELLDVRAGTTVVDVGCGAGRAVAELAARGVRAVGVDPDPHMIAVARERWPEGDFRSAGAYRLPLADGSAAGYRADKVFHELDAPERALREARRVLAPGGRIVLVGQDWDSLMVDSDDPGLTRTLVHARADLVTGPFAARRSRAGLLDAEFTDVTVEVHTAVFTGAAALPLLAGLVEAARTAGAVTGGQARAWLAEQRGRAGSDRLLMAVPMFAVSAAAPGGVVPG
ncbi:methyltransferase domain-containing protein [Streptomyces sp. NPDC018031]|uniref:methyltransferase domain-containing protein n=1 Tax=Streptomyces sp. NPDC018031 TaxID=3365033 RepID=UPI0037A0F576